MMSSGINLVMTVIGFAVSVLFIVFVCTRLIWARIQLNAARRAFARASLSDLSTLERGVNGLDPLAVSNLPTKNYGELCLSSQENSQCTVCLADYNNEDRLRILPVCGHSFHATCIDRWLQQHSTCPVCRISLREIPDRKWFMQPMFCSAVRSQQHSMPSVNPYCCRCMGNGSTHSSRSLDNQIMEPPTHEDREGNAVNSQVTKESTNQKIESASDQ